MRLAEEGFQMKHKRVVLIIILLTSICFTLGTVNILPLVKAPVSTGTIKIIKDAQPDFNLKFWFTGDLGKKFDLTDYPSKNNEEIFENIPTGTYVVTEELDKWWKLDNVIITGDTDLGSTWTPGTNYVTIDLDPGENIEVTFVNKPKTIPAWTIEYLGHTTLDTLDIKFTYRITSTEQYAISNWQLYCCCLNDDVTVIDASEKYEVKDHWIKFDKGYSGDETRIVWFVIHLEYYTACRIGDTTYVIKGAELAKEGTTTGPTCGPGFYIPENPLGTLGAIIPLLVALGLVIASKKNMITITVEK
jgi:hypothetical protein